MSSMVFHPSSKDGLPPVKQASFDLLDLLFQLIGQLPAFRRRRLQLVELLAHVLKLECAHALADERGPLAGMDLLVLPMGTTAPAPPSCLELALSTSLMTVDRDLAPAGSAVRRPRRARDQGMLQAR